MERFAEYLPENWEVYAAFLLILLPIVVVFRKQMLPVLQWIIEIGIYMVIVHFLLHGVARLAAWFKTESQTYVIEERQRYAWTTPIRQFWDRSLYNPEWLFWFELVLLAFIMFIVFKYRPMPVQRIRPNTRPKGRLAAQHAGRPPSRLESGGGKPLTNRGRPPK